jgi:dGTPase
MRNGFYNEFDFATPGDEHPREDEYRSLFQIHRDRIIHTAAFRRLQGKTQVFLTGEFDFYRTRLTHSLEVSQVGRSVCAALARHSRHLDREFFIDPDLVEAACLAHDLGHPPFGHAGERSLHRLMMADGGFEGNAQTLRLLTETIFAHGARGMNPSRALLDAVLKYKSLRRESPGAARHFLYDEQECHLEFTHGGPRREETSAAGSSVTDGSEPGGAMTAMGEEPHAPASARADAPHDPARAADMRSVECQIMDWADDTAYSLNDLADGVTAGFITVERLERWAGGQSLDRDAARHVDNLAAAIREDRVETRSNRRIGDFIAACSLAPRRNALSSRTNRHAFALVVDPAAAREAALCKRIAHDLVFRTPQLQQLDFKADQVLSRLHGALFSNYLDRAGGKTPGLLPRHVESTLARTPSRGLRARILCDFLADQTDNAASRLCMRLFDPDFGSILDLP